MADVFERFPCQPSRGFTLRFEEPQDGPLAVCKAPELPPIGSEWKPFHLFCYKHQVTLRDSLGTKWHVLCLYSHERPECGKTTVASDADAPGVVAGARP